MIDGKWLMILKVIMMVMVDVASSALVPGLYLGDVDTQSECIFKTFNFAPPQSRFEGLRAFSPCRSTSSTYRLLVTSSHIVYTVGIQRHRRQSLHSILLAC
jgi:hypothetical protein